MIEVYIGKIPEKIEPELLRELLRHVSVEKKQKIARFIKQDDVYRTLLADILVRSIICRKLQLKNHEIDFSNNLYGKPHLCNATDFQFNVSHSGEWIACAVDKNQIGVDIEKIEPIDSISISESFFSSEEYNDLLIKNGNERLTYFYELWTMKESYIKAVGKGLAIPLHSVAVKRYRQNYMEIEEVNSHIQYYCKQYYVDDSHKFFVCSESNDFPGRLTFINFSELIIKFIKIARLSGRYDESY